MVPSHNFEVLQRANALSGEKPYREMDEPTCQFPKLVVLFRVVTQQESCLHPRQEAKEGIR